MLHHLLENVYSPITPRLLYFLLVLLRTLELSSHIFDGCLNCQEIYIPACLNAIITHHSVVIFKSLSMYFTEVGVCEL